MASAQRPNRIQELREAAGMTQDELAARVGTSAQQVGRHERGQRRLTIQWLNRYAAALEVAPVALLSEMHMPFATASEVEPATIDGMPTLSRIIESRGLSIYRVLHSRVPDAGIQSGQIIAVDATEAARSGAGIGSIMLVRMISAGTLMLRQFVPPALLITNEPGGGNSLLRLDDPNVEIQIVGIVVQD